MYMYVHVHACKLTFHDQKACIRYTSIKAIYLGNQVTLHSIILNLTISENESLSIHPELERTFHIMPPTQWQPAQP